MVRTDDFHDRARFDALPDAAPRDGVSAPWDMFWGLLIGALACFGSPKHLFDHMCLRVKQKRDFAKMIRALESLMRRILLILALDDHRPITPRKPRGPIQRTSAPAPRLPWSPHYPEAMNALFVVSPNEPRPAK